MQSATESIAEETAQKEAAPTYSFVDVRKAFSAKSHAGYTTEVKDFINHFISVIARYLPTSLPRV